MAKKIVKCNACLKANKKGTILTAEGNPFPCPYCNGSTKRTIDVPDPTHRMERKWHTEVIAPCGTPRFYSVRKCLNCEKEEWQHAAGHFFNGLLSECTGTE